MTVRYLALLTIALTLIACTSAEQWRTRAEEQLRIGEDDAAAETLMKALEAFPDDVELLLITGEMYLRPIPEHTYKPRLALHYALRADKAAVHQDRRATALLTRAYRATGGSAFGDEIVQRGLQQVGHRDALAPKRLSAADPDLLEMTSENLREQARREAARKEGSTPCSDGFAHVPGGRYPGPGGAEIELAAFCVSLGGRSDADCAGARRCSADERLLACTALAAVLGDDPGCTDPAAPRCCADPSIAAAGAGH